jgi:hypothetical protein
MGKALLRIIIIGVGAYFASGVYLYLNQRNYIYFPTPVSADRAIDNFDLNNGEETLKILALNRGSEKAIIYFGGNAENVDYLAPLMTQWLPSFAVYLVNYRGYGGSSGLPSETALFQDALAVYDHIKTGHSDISVIGRSLGSGVAVFLAANRDVGKLVLVTPYDSIQSIAKQMYPVYPISIMLKDKFDSLGRVKSVSAKTLILIAENDRIIPQQNSVRLASAFKPEQLIVRILARADHNALASHPDYAGYLMEFLETGGIDDSVSR